MTVQQDSGISKTTRSYFTLILRYVIAGVSGVVANFLVFTTLLTAYDIWYIYAAFWGFVAAYVVTFTLHKYWTFKERSADRLYRQSGLYLFSAVSVLILNITALHVLVTAGVTPIIAQFVSLGFVAILSFIFTSKVTFAARDIEVSNHRYETIFTPSNPHKLSIIIPVYNEEDTILELLQKVEAALVGHEIEVIIVDDGSTDSTRDLLTSVVDKHTVLFQSKNGGKGSAIRAGIDHASGTHIVIQDGDLEYDPRDLATMFSVMIERQHPVLYGSRSLATGRNKNAGFSFYWGGQLVTVVTNVLYQQRLTDEPTCYKMFDAALLKSLPLQCTGFEFCPEVTALVARKGVLIPEIPISYAPRAVSAGKKIKWRDGVEAIYTLIKYRL